MLAAAMASTGRMIDRHRVSPGGALRTKRDVAEKRAEEPERGADQRENPDALRRLAEKIGRERCAAVPANRRARRRRAAVAEDQLWSGHRELILRENPPGAYCWLRATAAAS